MSGIVTTYANAILDADLANGTPHIALTSTVPTASSAGTELTGNNYSRLAATYAAAAAGAAGLAVVQLWATPSADWGAAVGFEVYDAATNGNRLYWGTLPGVVAKANVPLVSPAGAFEVSITEAS